jgi:hypothetical protein
MRSCVAASAARYEGIVDTIVQLFPPPFRWLNRACSRRRSIAEISDIVDLARARQVTGPVPHVDGSAHGADSAGNEER